MSRRTFAVAFANCFSAAAGVTYRLASEAREGSAARIAASVADVTELAGHVYL